MARRLNQLVKFEVGKYIRFDESGSVDVDVVSYGKHSPDVQRNASILGIQLYLMALIRGDQL